MQGSIHIGTLKANFDPQTMKIEQEPLKKNTITPNREVYTVTNEDRPGTLISLFCFT